VTKRLILMLCAALLCAVFVAACGDDDGGGGGGGDGGPDDETDGGGGNGSDWESVDVAFEDDDILTESVTYRSEGLLIKGQVCRPKSAGPHPMIVYNHGGFSGLGVDPMSGNCTDTARNGFVWIGSSYRGEDGSDGEIEVCLGEVTDVLAMIDIALAQPYVDPDRVFMWGGSHGGCITTRALQRGAPVHAAVDVFGPTDMAANYQFWVDGIANESEYSAFYESLIDTLDTAVGGPPSEYPEAYEARSPVAFADDLPAGVPFLITQGVVDPLIPPQQSCALAAAIGAGTVEAYHLDGEQMEVTSPPPGCDTQGLTWSAGPRPVDTWPGDRYLVVYDELDHSFAGDAGAAMLGDVIGFFVARTPP
jgi:dienelactone hydrolase